MQVNSCMNEQSMNDSFNEFSSTFMLDEELELEQKTVKYNHPSALERYSMLFQFFVHLYLLMSWL